MQINISMNYDYANPFLEVTFPNGNIIRINKKIIKTIKQLNSSESTYVIIRVEGDSYRFDGTLEEFDKNSRTIFI